MLERLRIQNFKSWQDTGDMAFGSLIGFFETNLSGKSSILQFLLHGSPAPLILLKRSQKGQPNPAGPFGF